MGSSAHMERAQTVQGRSNTHGAVVSGKSVLLQHAPVDGSEVYAAPSTPEGEAPVSPDQPSPPFATAAASASSDETGAAFARANRANTRANERAAARAAERAKDKTEAGGGSEQPKAGGGGRDRLKANVNPRARGTPGKSSVRQALIDKLMAERGLSARKSTTARGREARKNRREEVSLTPSVLYQR